MFFNIQETSGTIEPALKYYEIRSFTNLSHSIEKADLFGLHIERQRYDSKSKGNGKIPGLI